MPDEPVQPMIPGGRAAATSYVQPDIEALKQLVRDHRRDNVHCACGLYLDQTKSDTGGLRPHIHWERHMAEVFYEAQQATITSLEEQVESLTGYFRRTAFERASYDYKLVSCKECGNSAELIDKVSHSLNCSIVKVIRAALGEGE